MTPTISIIIPTFNRAHIIGETLDSIRAQTLAQWECIVVDDGSNDATEELMKTYIEDDARFHYYHRPKDRQKGPNSCRNYGFEQSKGRYVQWFDSDDLYHPEALEQLLSYFKDEDDAVVSKIDRIDLTTGAKMSPNHILSNQVIKDYFTGEITYYVCGPLWKRDFLQKQPQLFDEVIGNLDDWDFNLRMLYANPKITYIDKAFITYRIHPNSFSKELKKINLDEIKSDLYARDKHIALLKQQEDPRFYHLFVLDRIKLFYKTAMREKKSGTGYLLAKLLQRQLVLGRIGAATRSLFVHLLYKVTGKGDLLLK